MRKKKVAIPAAPLAPVAMRIEIKLYADGSVDTVTTRHKDMAPGIFHVLCVGMLQDALAAANQRRTITLMKGA